jgi:hypothetical protein
MTQPFGSPQGPLSFSAPSVASAGAGAAAGAGAGAGAGADVAGVSASAFFSVEVNGFEVLAVFGVVLF